MHILSDLNSQRMLIMCPVCKGYKLPIILFKIPFDQIKAGNSLDYYDAFTFKTDSKIGTKYGNSPFYKGTILWNRLGCDVQLSEDRWIFKGILKKMYKQYVNILLATML